MDNTAFSLRLRPLSRRLAPALCAGLLALLLPAAAAADLDLELRYWAPDLDSTIGTFGGVSIGSDGIAVDAGLDAENDFEGRITLRPGLGVFFRGAYQNVAADGGGRFEIDLGSIIFQFPVDVTTAIDFDYARFALGWQYTTPSKRVRLGPFVEAKGVRGDALFAAGFAGLGGTVVEEFETGFLAAGGLVELWPTEKLEVFVEASVLVEDDDADLTDAEAGVRYFFNKNIGVGGGYRTLDIDGRIDDVDLDFEFSGAFATAVFRF